MAEDFDNHRRIFDGSGEDYAKRAMPMKGLLIILPFVVLLWRAFCFAGAVEDGLAAYKRGDYRTAVAIWTIAANKGDAEAQNDLGLLYGNGQGVAQDYNQAVSWYRKAAEKGYAEAQNNLGLTYAKGRGVPQDNKQAVSWFRKAAEKGFPRAQIYLASLYEKGLGVPQDYAEAEKWYSLAVANSSLNKEQRELAIKGRDNAAKKIKEAQNQAQPSPGTSLRAMHCRTTGVKAGRGAGAKGLGS
jgi:hypothetical protein